MKILLRTQLAQSVSVYVYICICHQIHGLTTAASIWLAASIGVAVGGGYYFISFYSVILIVKVLKYGPRIFYQKDDTARYESEVSVLTM